MTKDELRRTILSVLAEVAPDADLDALAPDLDLRQQLDIDSMDVLNFVIALHEATGVEIPERDYTKLVTVDAAAEYLAARVADARR